MSERDPEQILTCPQCGLSMPRLNWPTQGWPRTWGRVIEEMRAEGRTPRVLADLTMDECGLERVCPTSGCDGRVEDADDIDP